MRSLVKRLYSQQKGLTAIELSVVVAIVAILAGLVASSVTGMNQSARNAAVTTDISEVQKSVYRWVGEQPASRYPVATPVIVDSSNAVNNDVTPTTRGLPPVGSGLFVRIAFSDVFTNPEGVSKSFVPDSLQRIPKYGQESPNPWVMDENGTVKMLATASAYTPTSTQTPAPTNTPTQIPIATATPTPTVGQGASGLTIVGTVTIPAPARLIAANSSTHRAYVAVGTSYNPSTYYVSVISGTTDIADIPVGTGDGSTGPTWLAVNATTNRVYVNHTGSNFATAINAGTNSVIGSITTGYYPEGIATNPLTNRLYIANTNSGNVSVFDTTSDANTLVTTIAIPGSGAGITNLSLAIIPLTNRVFVAAPGLNKIFVIDTSSNAIVQAFTLTWSPSGAFAANASSNQLYVPTSETGTINVLDAATGTSVATVSVDGGSVYWLAINPTLNHIYATTSNSSLLTVIDGATNSVLGTIDIGANGQTVAADSSNGSVYVATVANSVVVLDD